MNRKCGVNIISITINRIDIINPVNGPGFHI